MSKCASKDRNNNPCRNCTEDGSKFCKNHQYMVNYTPEMLCALQLCKGCKKMYYFDGDVKQCVKCSERGNEIRIKAKDAVVLCKSDGCKYKRSTQNIYCGLHQLCLFVDECENEGVRPCTKYLKGCRTKLGTDYANKSCQECLQKERDRDNAKRSSVSCEVIDGMKQCSVCCKSKPSADYLGKGNDSILRKDPKETLVSFNNVNEVPNSDLRKDQKETSVSFKTCSQCRDEFKRQNEKRDKEHVRELDRINSKKPERVAAKHAWEEANPEKVVLKTLNYRGRQHNENQEQYLKRNAETMANWRENNPEKMKEMNDARLKNVQITFNHYKYDCTIKRRLFELSFEEFDSTVKDPCYYCGIVQDKGFNGIDRMDQTQGYVIENCVSCCKLCNFMKGAVDNITFLQRVEHILKHNNMIPCGNYYPSAFQNHKSLSYSEYKRNAEARGYCFEISIEEFNAIILENCYICGKKNHENHTNGVDRFDNEVGYTIDNVNACCGECNFMKKDTEYDLFMDQLHKIYECSSQKEMTKPSVTVTNILSPNLNKMTTDEVHEHQHEQMQLKRKAMREKYTDQEFLKKHAKEVVENRRNI